MEIREDGIVQDVTSRFAAPLPWTIIYPASGREFRPPGSRPETPRSAEGDKNHARRE